MKSHRAVILTGLFAALTGIGAYLKIPLPTIPVTLQTFFVYLSANMLGAFYGPMSQALYLAIGLIGIPVFAMGGGPGYFVQPTFGYLASYPVSAFVIGSLLKMFKVEQHSFKKNTSHLFIKIFAADFVGLLVIFTLGLGYLYLNLRWGFYIKFNQTAAMNLLEWKKLFSTTLIFIFPIELLKVFLAALVTKQLYQKYFFLKIPKIQRA